MSAEKRDWLFVLAKAKAEGLYPGALAKHLGVRPSTVCKAERRHGIVLQRKHPPTNPHGRSARKVTYEQFREAVIEGVDVNAFCIEAGISFTLLQKLEKMYGMKLPRRKARSAEGARA